jgi:hypothetical protein
MTTETKPNGGPAFPRDHAHDGHNGMTLREYAAIQLKVPDSGTDWLDAMIRTAQRNELAARAMQGFCINRVSVLYADAADEAHRMAGAMQKAGNA